MGRPLALERVMPDDIRAKRPYLMDHIGQYVKMSLQWRIVTYIFYSWSCSAGISNRHLVHSTVGSRAFFCAQPSYLRSLPQILFLLSTLFHCISYPYTCKLLSTTGFEEGSNIALIQVRIYWLPFISVTHPFLVRF